MTYPALCPICSCPIQLLASGNHGETKGDIHDAMRRHYAVVHPFETDDEE